LLYKKLNYSTRILTKQQQQTTTKMRLARIYDAKFPFEWKSPRRPASNYVNMDKCIGAGAIIMSKGMFIFGYRDSYDALSNFISVNFSEPCRDPRYLASKIVYELSAGLIKINYTELNNNQFVDWYPRNHSKFFRCYLVTVNGLDDLLFRKAQLRHIKTGPYSIGTFTKIVKVPVANTFDVARDRNNMLTDIYGDQYCVDRNVLYAIKMFVGRLFDK
jgi:hypothetical protein